MDAVFKALSDETRRTLLDMLRKRDGQTLSELEQKLGMTRFGVMKHLKVLEEASLVVTRRSGRFKHHYLNAVPLQEVLDRWIEPLIHKPMARMALDLKAQLEGTAAMTKPAEKRPDFVLETFIRTTADRLWNAIVDPDTVKQYHFAAAMPRGSFETGGRVEFMTPDGGIMLAGDIIEADPPRRLDMTFEPGWMGPGAKASRCVYEIADMGETCKLTILHYDIPEGQDGVRDGWARVASSMKSFLETGKPLAFTG
jgi:DNA-binding transcriptional ArsR family regulator/uncharacterized protein YndB with AHSA1/START domain